MVVFFSWLAGWLVVGLRTYVSLGNLLGVEQQRSGPMGDIFYIATAAAAAALAVAVNPEQNKRTTRSNRTGTRGQRRSRGSSFTATTVSSVTVSRVSRQTDRQSEYNLEAGEYE